MSWGTIVIEVSVIKSINALYWIKTNNLEIFSPILKKNTTVAKRIVGRHFLIQRDILDKAEAMHLKLSGLHNHTI